MVSNLIGNEAPLAGVAGSSPVSSALSRTETFGFFVSCFYLPQWVYLLLLRRVVSSTIDEFYWRII